MSKFQPTEQDLFRREAALQEIKVKNNNFHITVLNHKTEINRFTFFKNTYKKFN